ncbi:MAG: NAD(+)/NADH kinase [Muribaculaceae bacterium]|nr:NAD(+)/NADH kinase [Muribaculaceae bacterium]
MDIAIYGNEYQGKHLEAVWRLLHELQRDNHRLTLEKKFAQYLAKAVGSDDAWDIVDHSKRHDLALSLGGDGTLLRTARLLHASGTPIMGLNTGHLGYLTATTMSEAADLVARFERGECRIEERTMLTVARQDGTPIPAEAHATALNEIALLRHDTSSMIEMETRINGVPLTVYKGDGLVVCTPSGSTAYNLSAGGPIMDPTTACLALTPLSPHSLTMRPMVVRDDAVITITTRSRTPQYQVSVDGDTFVCPNRSTVVISKAPHPLRLVLGPNHNFAVTLRRKLLWGA